MKGGHTSKLVIYVDIPCPENGVRTDKEVEMKEVSQNTAGTQHYLEVNMNVPGFHNK